MKQPLIAFGLFWLLACALGWGAFALRPHTGAELDGLAALLANPMMLIAKFSPSIAGLALLAVGGRGVRTRFLDAAARPRIMPIVLALVVPGVLTAGALATANALRALDAGALLAGFNIASLAYWIGLRTLLGGGLGEEPGLRGVALPLLLERMGPRRAALLMGVCWGIWHLPALWGRPPELWAGQFALTISGSLIMTFVWVRFGPSLWAAMLFHGSLNGWSAFTSNHWAHHLGAVDGWQVIRLLALLLLALTLLPLSWRRQHPTHGVPS